jgi:hypothetical protein
MLGSFSVYLDGRQAGPWARPPAKRLIALLLLSSGRRTRREAAGEALFHHCTPRPEEQRGFEGPHHGQVGPGAARWTGCWLVAV